MKHKEGGFTIVEVTIIVVVVGILASIVTISIANARTISRDNTWRLNAQAIASKLELYYKQGKDITTLGMTYPTTKTITNDFSKVIDNPAVSESPTSSGNSLFAATTASRLSANDVNTGVYIYQPFDSNGKLCVTAPCVRYVLYYYNQAHNTVRWIDSLRQQ